MTTGGFASAVVELITTRDQMCCADGCERPIERKKSGLCEMHYYRQRRTGSLELLPRHPRPSTPCAIDGCSGSARRWAGGEHVCQTHAKRHARTGSFDRQVRATLGVCIVDDCETVDDGPAGYCRLHRQRIARHGHPGIVIVRRADVVTNSGMHQRLRRERGPAADLACVDCGDPAAHWSYDHLDPNELTDPVKGPYSLDPERYAPRCVPCHKRFDLDHLERAL